MRCFLMAYHEGFSETLLRTKLYRPPVTRNLVVREMLIDRLNRGLDHPLILVSAPAGYGKTTLVSSWLETCPLPSIWLSLDENDSDLRVCLEYLLAAIESGFPGSTPHTGRLMAASSPLRVMDLALSLANELDELDRELVLVLDDLHRIVGMDVYRFLDALLQHPPPGLHIVLVTRLDPPLYLGLFRGRGQITEIRGPDLRFSVAESQTFIDQRTVVPLGEEARSLLIERAEGWAAGLQLALLALNPFADLNRQVEQWRSPGQLIAEYLLEEVLANIPREMEGFLLRTSILDDMCDSLCDAVMELDDMSKHRGQTYLQWLAQANMFTEPLDRTEGWYRYHHLFRDLLRNRLLNRLDEDEINALHLRASAWYASHGQIGLALQHALAGNGTSEAVQLVAQHRHRLLETEQRPRLQRWLQLFSDATIAQHPDLLLGKAWLLHYGRLDAKAMLEVLGQAEALIDQMTEQPERARQLQGEIDTLRSFEQNKMADDPQRVIALSTRALAALPREWYFSRAVAWAQQALAYQMIGQLDHALAILASSREEDHAVFEEPRVRILSSTCLLHWLAADTDAMLKVARQSLRVCDQTCHYECVTWCNYFLASAYYIRNQLEEAERHASIVWEQRFVAAPAVVLHSAFVLAAIHQARGRPERARAALDHANGYLLETRGEPMVPVYQGFDAELALRQGDLETAERWAATIGPIVPRGFMGFFYVVQLTSPKVYLALNTPASRNQAAKTLAELYDFVTSTHNTRSTIDVLALRAMLHAAEGDEPAALDTLEEAVILAQPGQIVRAFADLGPILTPLLIRLRRRGAAEHFIDQIIAAMPTGPFARQPVTTVDRSGLVEPITPREMDVLELLAQRMTDKEIAVQLHISSRTVMRHTANLYQKLGVSNRRDCVAVAMSLGILPSHFGVLSTSPA
jgi:LuxR family maltose regulon positive regulatory protein